MMKPCLYQHILTFHLIPSALSDLGELIADPSSPTPHPRALICACGAQGDPGHCSAPISISCLASVQQLLLEQQRKDTRHQPQMFSIPVAS